MTELRFNSPTLITLTAPTCAGKNHLLEVMLGEMGCERIVSTTDRAPRKGEIDGLHYNFISTEESRILEVADKFAELVTYNGVRYGVTHDEMAGKMLSGKPPIVIMTPEGIEIYRKYCATKGWQIFNVYVETQESIRIKRLAKRTADDVVAGLRGLSFDSVPTEELADKIAADVVEKVLHTNNKRLIAILQEERSWSNSNRWDCIVSGTSTEEAKRYLLQGVKNRNARSDIYS
jgi:guanylate kinase